MYWALPVLSQTFCLGKPVEDGVRVEVVAANTVASEQERMTAARERTSAGGGAGTQGRI